MTSSLSTTAEKIYRPRQVWQFIYFFLITLFGLMTLMALLSFLASFFSFSTSYKWVSIGVNGLLMVIAAFYTWFFVQDFGHHKLVISPKGIEYYRFHYFISATWDNVEKNENKLGNPTLLLRNFQITSRRYYSWVPGEKNRMPINIFGDWQKNGLRDSLVQFAPHLFEKA